jgi:hypothetical protein
MLHVRGHRGHDAQSLLRTAKELSSFVKSRGYRVERFVVDAGKVEASDVFVSGCNDSLSIAVDPVPPKSQHMNLVERSVQTIDNKTNAVLAQAVSGGTLGDNAWFSSLKIVVLSLITQVRRHSFRGVTAYEDYYKEPPNLNDTFVFRLGQIVTVTKLEEHRKKTSHELRGATCIALHPEPNRAGTWVWSPNNCIGLLRGNKDISKVEYAGIPNQSLLEYRPIQKVNRTQPDPSIIRLIEQRADMNTACSNNPTSPTHQSTTQASPPLTNQDQQHRTTTLAPDECPIPTVEEVAQMTTPQYWNNAHSTKTTDDGRDENVLKRTKSQRNVISVPY